VHPCRLKKNLEDLGTLTVELRHIEFLRNEGIEALLQVLHANNLPLVLLRTFRAVELKALVFHTPADVALPNLGDHHDVRNVQRIPSYCASNLKKAFWSQHSTPEELM
jgi:hypothetical protein